MGPRRSSQADEQRPSKCNAFENLHEESGTTTIEDLLLPTFLHRECLSDSPCFLSLQKKQQKNATPNHNLIPGSGKFAGLLFPNSKNGKYFCLHPWDHFFPYPPETKRGASVSTHLRPLPDGRTFLPAHAMTTKRARNQRKERGLVPPGEKAEGAHILRRLPERSLPPPG